MATSVTGLEWTVVATSAGSMEATLIFIEARKKLLVSAKLLLYINCDSWNSDFVLPLVFMAFYN